MSMVKLRAWYEALLQRAEEVRVSRAALSPKHPPLHPAPARIALSAPLRVAHQDGIVTGIKDIDEAVSHLTSGTSAVALGLWHPWLNSQEHIFLHVTPGDMF